MIRDERGFTLAEILVAVAVIAIGLVGLAAVIPVSTWGVQEGNQVSTATFLAAQRLEQVRNAAWITSPANDCLGVSASGSAAPTSTTCTLAGTCTSGSTCTTFPDESNVSGFTGYGRTVRVSDCSSGGGCAGVTTSDLRLVTVAVSFTPLSAVGVGTSAKSVTLESLLAKR